MRPVEQPPKKAFAAVLAYPARFGAQNPTQTKKSPKFFATLSVSARSKMLRQVVRSFCRTSHRRISHRRHLHRVCVVGSGPAGFYTAEELLKTKLDVKIDILERLPAPFGLVRYGVAPDHPEVKLVSHKFEEIAQDPRVRYFGNVGVGKDVSIEDLKQHYDAIVLAYGADDDRRLGVRGEDLKNIHGAKYAI
jgi:adrenodoxin-NADP+ reductase